MTSEILDREPPWSAEAETAVLCGILLSPQAYEDVADIVAPADFHDDANRRLFQAMADVHESGRPVDAELVRDALRDSGEYERIGGGIYLARTMTAGATAAHARYHAMIIRERSQRRRIIDAALMAIRQAHSGTDAASIAGLLCAEMDGVSVRTDRHMADAKEVAQLLVDNYERRKTGQVEAIPTGLATLDRFLGGGFGRTDYVVIGARTSFGKTALALSLLSQIATDTNRLALLFSIEMTREEIADRLAAAIGQLPSLRLKLGRLSQSDERQLVETAGELARLSFKLDDSPSQTVASIARTARREARRKPLSCIVVDYLQLLEATKRADRRDLELAYMSRKLKALSQEIQAPVIVLAQLNREADGTRPRMTHLREADSIAHEANVVLLLDRPSFNDEQPPETGEECKLIVEKNRNGPRGVSVPLLFFAKYTRFVEAAPVHVEPPAWIQAFDDHNNGD